MFNYVPKILSLVLAQAKIGNEQFWKKKFHVVNGKAQHALTMAQFFPFMGGVEAILSCWKYVRICDQCLTLPLAHAKVVINNFGNKSFM